MPPIGLRRSRLRSMVRLAKARGGLAEFSFHAGSLARQTMPIFRQESRGGSRTSSEPWR